MNINPLWSICLIIRLSLIFIIRYFYNNSIFKNITVIILLIIGVGFIYKYITGSNNEIQLSKVFWNETRYIHGFFYILASYYLFCDNINMNTLMLSTDIGFSILYRIITNQ